MVRVCEGLKLHQYDRQCILQLSHCCIAMRSCVLGTPSDSHSCSDAAKNHLWMMLLTRQLRYLGGLGETGYKASLQALAAVLMQMQQKIVCA